MIPSADGFIHSAMLYSDTEQYLAGVVGFVRSGLAVPEPVAVAAPQGNLALLEGALHDDAGRVRFYDMADVGRNPGRIIPTVLCAFADAHPTCHVRVVTESVWPGRTPEEVAACVQHEALVNLAFTGRQITVMCPYEREALDVAALADVRATHPELTDGSRGRRNASYTPGEVMIAWGAPLPEPATAFTLPFDLATFAAVRPAAAAHARRAGMPEQRVHAVGVAVSELATNSIRYGGGGGTMRVWTADGLLVCEVSDRGRLDDPLAGRRPVPASHLSGRGLLLVNLLTDLVRIRSTSAGTTVRFHMVIDRSAPDDPAGDD